MPDKIALANEAARLDTLRAVELEAARATFDRIAFLVQCFAGAPIAQVELVGADQVWSTGVTDVALPAPPRAQAFAARAIAGDKVMWVEDATRDRRFSANPLVTGETAIRFYAGAPIRLSGGVRIGTVAIMDRKPRPFDAYMAARLEDFAALAAEEWDSFRAIKALKRAVSDASAASVRMEALIETLPVALVMTDRDLRVLRANSRWLAERGMSGMNVVGERLQDLFPGTHEQRSAGYEAALNGEVLRWDRMRLNLPNGQRPWIRGEAAPWRDADGAIAGLVIKSHDITDMVEAVDAAEHSEQRLRLATQMAELLVWEADIAGGTMKTFGETLSHLQAQVGDRGVSVDDLWKGVHPADRPAAIALWDRHVETGAPFRTTYRLTQPDAAHMWVAAAAEVVSGEDGEPERIVGVLKNIDREKRAEQATVKALEAAETANRSKNEFLANMSHEIRTPLNGVMGIASALGRTTLTPAQKEMVDLIGASAHTLEALLSDVLDLARIESGKLELRDEVFDLGETVRLVAGLFEPRARDKGLVFKTAISPAAYGLVRGDVIRLRQIVSNLLSNAVKFTDRGKVILHAEAERIGEAVRIKLSVVDSGIGFDKEAASRLFQRFEQADGSITRRFGGTGLGLAISKSLAVAMQGDLTAASTPGKGAVFTFVATFPAAETETPAMGAADMALAADLRRALADATGEAEPRPAAIVAIPSPAPKSEPAPPAPAALRILLAEDHPTNRKVVNLILQAIGVDLTNVENGQQAVEAAADGGVRPDPDGHADAGDGRLDRHSGDPKS